MKRHIPFRATTLAIVLFGMALCVEGQAPSQPGAIAARDAVADGIRIHYLIAGHGPAVLLLHGYTQTSRMWRPLIPQLAQRFTVVAPDLPGIGDSEIPKDGIDIKTSAVRIHALAVQLHLKDTRVVGHDIGLMVAYAYAAMYPDETNKLVVLDAFLPGIAGWESYYNDPNIWHFRFHGPTPEALVAGRESIYFAYFWNDLAADKNHSLSPADRQAYVAAYSKAGRMRAGWAYFANWPQTAIDLAALGKTKLTVPVLAIAGDKASAATLMPQMHLVATNVQTLTLKDTGHWVMEERPKQTMDAIANFL
jgi:pimeloyl-ACP methyl ester carboxylesterase